MSSTHIASRALTVTRPIHLAVRGLLGLLLTGLVVAGPVTIAHADDADSSRNGPLPTVYVTAEKLSPYAAARSRTATKTDTALRDIPQAVTVITREAIDDQGMQNIADVVRYVPGIGMAQGEGNRETPVLRGSSTTADFFIDGMRDDVQYYRDLYNIEQVEALKGPNGMIFGRGGVGGVINRVSKLAGWDPVRQLKLQAGTDSNRRGQLDLGQGVTDNLAFRVNGMYEDSGSYRDDVTLERYGVNPTATYRLGANTLLIGGVEYFHDQRVADRGVSSFEGRPLHTDPAIFFGDPAQSSTHTTVRSANFLIEHSFGDSVTLRNRTRYADYDKFYQNVFPGAVDASGTTVAISAYNNATRRENFFNQTDVVYQVETGRVEHQVLAGLELGRQDTDNFRNTGFFDSQGFGTATVNVPISDPRTTLPVTFRQGPTDADNQGRAEIAAVYVQDQVELGRHFLATLGVRYDQFKVDFTNHRTATNIESDDNLLSPRAGLVYKPVDAVSIYTSFSKTYQPRAGEQLSSLSLTNQSLDPEEFTNYEVGAKWDLASVLSITGAVYQLKRTNVAIVDPANATQSLLVDGQRVRGVELGLAGNVTEAWSLMAAYAYQDGEILSDQSAAVSEGARLASLPRNTFSLWNRYDFSPTWSVGLGIVNRAKMLAATENLAAPQNNVTLDSYTRVDTAVFFRLNDRLRAQANIENILDEEYFAYAHSNTNITPGSPRAVRASFVYDF